MKKASKSAAGLKELINTAIQDLEITHDEYQIIVDYAMGDGYIDKEENALLSQFQEMIGNGTIKRVRSKKV